MNMKEIYGKAVTATDSLGYVIIHTSSQMEGKAGRATCFLKDGVKKYNDEGKPNVNVFTANMAAAQVFTDYFTAREEADLLKKIMNEDGKVSKRLIASIHVRQLVLAMPSLIDVDNYAMCVADAADAERTIAADSASFDSHKED